MARPIPDLDQMEANEVATDDDLLIDDVSAGETKRIQVGKLLGLPTVGWTAAGEIHTYSSWSASTRTGVITVPSDATTKYTPGMRYWINQSTGGNKYGIITKVTATTLTVFFQSGTTLNNETISSPYYSTEKLPFGFDADPAQWSIFFDDTNDQIRNSPTAGTWYNQGSLNLVIPIGAWDVTFKAMIGAIVSGTSSGAGATLSTANNTNSDPRFAMFTQNQSGITSHHQTFTTRAFLTLTSQTTYYVNICATSGSNTSVRLLGATVPTRVIATCGYL